jgi:hypothetical protein
MTVLAEAEKLVFSLPEKERAKLAERIIASLPGPFIDDDDDGIEEALRRSSEMDENPDSIISIEQLHKMIKERFPTCLSD